MKFNVESMSWHRLFMLKFACRQVKGIEAL